ncbi:uncharacterized protein K452DRAFT_298936 [Aplosporella prunicola CBS 121167]|uniref:Plasmid pRiA4b Orf3-like domain-containing protein n=1 Tax=Aplosporella prunicola CBS 121167 TaxID=1176127 RepID=A0A6A6BC74_9PEZI|nr:uncharacterized protein K452DRAFT_298936 [Aplosporella prunicola CBS 121167]KAF2140855.1 hypothetical protein K452DRAFT_298936 [Aplosporella prunicola CBS 121167]
MSDIDDPTVTRLLSVDADFTFSQLHEVIQIAFGWTNSHTYTFDVKPLPPENTNRPIFFRDTPLIQLSASGDSDFGSADVDFPIKKSAEYKLRDVYGADAYKGKVEIQYEYDMGDSWRHSIVLLGVADPTLRRIMGIPPEVRVVCLGGEGHPVAEDSGGPGGWDELKDLFRKPRAKDERKDWYKNGGCLNGDPKGLDPYRWDVLDVNDGLMESFPPPKE